MKYGKNRVKELPKDLAKKAVKEVVKKGTKDMGFVGDVGMAVMKGWLLQLWEQTLFWSSDRWS